MASTNSTPPILFLIFNRPATTERVFNAIRLARPTRLYVAADGPRFSRSEDVSRCDAAREIATAVDWPCELVTLFREENLGCRHAVSSAIEWFFKHETEGIILEDDCLPHPDFFRWCASMLERYRNEAEVMCVTGNNFQTNMTEWPESYYYSIYNHCWGWATWRSSWTKYDASLAKFEPKSARRLLADMSRVPGFAEAWINIFERVQRGELDSWAYVWTWSCWIQGGLTCTPRVNLVSNIGHGNDGTHTKSAGSETANLPTVSLPPPYAAPESLTAEQRFDDHVTRTHFGIHDRNMLHQATGRFKRVAKRVISVLRAET